MMGGHGGVRRGGDPCPRAAALHEAHDLAPSIACEQRHWVSWRRISRRARLVGRTHGECGVSPIREPHNAVRISALPDPDTCDPLAAERVMRMGDGHRCRRWLGTRGRVLWASRRGVTA
jgi:hypothetical protein